MLRIARWFGWTYTAYTFLFILAPIAASLVFSFNADRFPSLPLQGFTTEWYGGTFSDPSVIEAFQRSVMVSVPVALLSTVLGFCAAYCDFRFNFRGKSLFSLLMLLPPTIPAVIMGLGMLSYLSRINLAGEIGAVLISHVVIALPFAMAMIRLRLAQMDGALEEASWNLRASPTQTLWHVVIPFCKQSLFAAFLITAAVSFDEFAVAWFVSGLNETVPVRVLVFLQGQVSPVINAIGTAVFSSSILLVAIGMGFSGIGKAKRAAADNGPEQPAAALASNNGLSL
ncbi:ABC transporter permease [Azoarcus sp. KH32C]|uniref:ABC transporter permease n=1 Tax=Azoarcus sp. KH32C TaxID=748247 RepID=UPI0002385C9B|nr:ABC transporter permease [Azoarcus sp. KH32C]BAL26916.1 putative spermidine/putrescine transport system permease protein [Azoarcus sp. KH32C]